MSHPSLHIYKLRHLASEILPVEGSNIALDICLAVACHHCLSNALTMKQLVYELPYSEAGIQYNLRELRRDGWVNIRQSQADRRVRQLFPSSRLEGALTEYWQAIAETVKQASDAPSSVPSSFKADPEPQPFLKPPPSLG